MKQTDMLVVKVTLKTTAEPNDSDICKEWPALLQKWAEENGCVIDLVAWQHYRRRLVLTPAEPADSMYWDKIASSKI